MSLHFANFSDVFLNLPANHVIDVDDVELALGHHEYIDDTGCHSYGHDGAGVGDSRTVDLLVGIQ